MLMAVAGNHPSAADIEAFRLGTLDSAALAGIEAHMAVCPACQEHAAADSPDFLIELLRRAHARMNSQADTLPELAVQAPTPIPGPVDPNAPTLPYIPTAAEQAPAMPPELASHERYRIVRLLGEGGMGAVYEAEHSVMQRPVALKVIHRAFTANAAAVERFRREVRAAARLSHPNIVAAYDAEHAGDRHFLVMEFIKGVSLARLVKERGPLPIAEACDCIRQAALGLQHAHERGMVHRDVKPDNLIRTPDGVVKVLDFGLAALTAERGGHGLTEVNTLMGTPDYMAPEQAEDPRGADIRADVYSLGCTLYFLLTAQVPYPAATSLAKVLAHRERPAPSIRQARPETPPELGAVLARMLAKKPEDRPQTPGEAAAALTPFALPTAVQPPPTRRGRFVATAAAVLLVGGLLAVPLGYAIWAAFTYRVQTDNGEVVIQTDDPEIEILLKRGGQLVRIMDPKSKQTWELDTVSYQISMADKPDGLKIQLPGKEPFTLKRGEAGIVRVFREPKAVARVDAPKETPLTAPRTLEVERTLSWPGRNGGTAFSEDGRLCVGFARNDFRVWEVDSGKLVREFAGLPHVVTVRFLPSGKELLSSHTDGTFRRWDLAAGKEVGQLQGAVGWPLIGGITPDGARFCYWIGSAIVVGDLDKKKELFRVGPLTEKTVLVASHGLSPDGKRLLVADYHKDAVQVSLRIFDVDAGKLFKLISARVVCDNVAWSEDGRRVFANCGDEGKYLIASWEVETGELASKVQLVPDLGSSYGRCFTRDARYFGILYPDKRLLHLYDVRTGRLTGTAAASFGEFALSFSPNSRLAACGSQGEVILYRLPALPGAKDKP
jgi:WD40 repeat protein